MTGGVSLAVWMGGVTLEIRRLVCADAAWGALLDLMGTTAVVDIVSGTSAGGINGALLAAATTSDLDVETVAEMRDTWLELGSLTTLLRPTTEDDPPSLMRGDDYLLPELAQALRAWLRPGCVDLPDTDPAQETDLVLLLTASLLEGEPRIHRDDVGSLLSETEHLALFRFEGRDLRRPGAENRLAVAARTSASFPGAFEASYLAVTDTEHKVDLSDVVQLSTNRWAVDGGVVMNQPIEPALDAMYAQPARNETRRVLLSVEPDPGPSLSPEDADPAKPPSVRHVMARSILDLPKQQSVSAALTELRATNHRVEGQQRVRRELVHEAARDPDAIATLAARLYPVFASRRGTDLGRRTANRIASRSATLGVDAPFDWRAVEREMERASVDASWLPPPTADRSSVPRVPIEQWPWGISAVEFAVSTVGDLVRRVQAAMSLAPDEVAHHRRAELRQARALLNRVRRDLAELRTLSDQYWNLRILARRGRAGSMLDGWADGAFADWPMISDRELVAAAPLDPKGVVAYRTSVGQVTALMGLDRQLTGDDARHHLGYLASWLATLVEGAAPTLDAILERAGTQVAHELRDLNRALAPPPGVDGRDAIEHVVEVLLSLFIVQVAVDGDTATREQTAELVQISAEAASPLDPSRNDPGTKLAGAQAAHFGAFYKRSWRANDWTWGRLDGSARLVRVVLDPQRLAQRFAHVPTTERVEAVLDALGAVVTDHAGPSTGALTRSWSHDRPLIAAELAWLTSDDPDIPGSLPAALSAVTRRFHHDILRDELPRLAASVEESRVEGGDVSAEASRFRRLVDEASEGGEIPGDAIQDLFDAWQIGNERLADETDTPLFVATVTKIAAVTAAAGQESRRGLGILRFPLFPLRWFLRGVERVVDGWVRWRA